MEELELENEFQTVLCNIVCPSDELRDEIYNLLVDENGEVDFSILKPIELKDVKHLDKIWGTFGCEKVELDKENNRVVLFAKGNAPLPIFDELAKRYKNESFAVLIDGPDEIVDHAVFTYGFGKCVDIEGADLNISQEEATHMSDELYFKKWDEMSEKMEEYAFSKMREVYAELEDTDSQAKYEESLKADNSDDKVDPEVMQRTVESLVNHIREEDDPLIKDDLERNGDYSPDIAPDPDEYPDGEGE